MVMIPRPIKCAVTAITILVAAGLASARAQVNDLDDLFAALREADGEGAQVIERKIWEEWSRSGSPAMDLLLQRGRDALEADATTLAIGHFSAVIDHAPDFAEGYNMRATAFYGQGRFGEALEDIRATLALNPRHFGALSGLAVILEDLGMDDQALAASRAVSEIYPARIGLQEAIDRLSRAVEGERL